jgi:signal transduction histidine kinase
MGEEPEFVALLDDEGSPPIAATAPPWKVAVVDDDVAVHTGTRFALEGFSLNGRRLELHFAESAVEARAILERHSDMAVILLDVVMETENAGLELVEYVRKELQNRSVRIILRTGQPGQAPERRVVVDYDINDYKAKTELTADKLFTAMTSALRSYEQLVTLMRMQRGLEGVVEAAAGLLQERSLPVLADSVLRHIGSLLEVEASSVLAMRDPSGPLSFLAATGRYNGASGLPNGVAPAELTQRVEAAAAARAHEFAADVCSLYVATGSGRELVAVVECGRPLSDVEKALLEVLCGRLAAAFDNAMLYDELERANADLEGRVALRTSELLTATERLESQSASLRRANAFKGEVLGKIAHDLKNPLSVILGRMEILTELLATSAQPAEAATAQIEHVTRTALRLTAMVDDLVADAMADADAISVRECPVDLSALASEVVEANRGLAAAKEQSIQLSAEPSLQVRGDTDRLREAIDNLVSNAVKYSRPGGRIDVTASVEGSAAIVRVADDGPGLLPEDMSRLFGRFQRLSAKPTGGEGSTGLGLSIAKRIVELHKGRIFVESAGSPGGAVFAIALPLTPEAEAP